MSLDNLNSFGKNIALFFNGRVSEFDYHLIKKEIKSKGNRIIPILYKNEEDLPASQLGINLADQFYIFNARPLNERTQKLIGYAESTNKPYNIFNNVKEITQNGKA